MIEYKSIDIWIIEDVDEYLFVIIHKLRIKVY